MENIKTRVINLIAELLGIDKSKITLESDLIKDLGADELDMIELVMMFEEEFEIEIIEEIEERLFIVKDIIDYLKNQI